MVRVLVLSAGPPDPALPAGIGGLCGALADLGHDVRLAVPTIDPTRPGPSGVEILVGGEAPPVIPPDHCHRVERALALDTRLYAAAVRSLRSRPADVIVADGWEVSYAAGNLRSSHGLPILARLDALVDEEPASAGGQSDLVTQITSWLTDEARLVVVPTRFHRDRLTAALGVPAGKITVVPPGVEAPAHPGRVGDERRVLLAPSNPAGTGVVLSLRRRGVTVTLARPGVAQVRDAALVVVLDPSRPDLVVAGMAAGRVVVVPASGPLRGLIHGGRGGTPVADDAGLVATVARILRDGQRLRRLQRAAARQAARRHGWLAVAHQHAALLARTVTEEAMIHDEVERPDPRPVLLRPVPGSGDR